MTDGDFYEADASSSFCHAVRTKIVLLCDCDGGRDLQFFYDGVCGTIDI
jgi:hypothetical protein